MPSVRAFAPCPRRHPTLYMINGNKASSPSSHAHMPDSTHICRTPTSADGSTSAGEVQLTNLCCVNTRSCAPPRLAGCPAYSFPLLPRPAARGNAPRPRSRRGEHHAEHPPTRAQARGCWLRCFPLPAPPLNIPPSAQGGCRNTSARKHKQIRQRGQAAGEICRAGCVTSDPLGHVGWS